MASPGAGQSPSLPATDADINAAPLPEPSHAITPAPPCLTNTNAVHFHFLSHNPCLHAKRGDFPPPPYQGAMKIDVLRMRHQLVRRGHSGHRAIAPACLMSQSSIHVLPDCPARQPMWMHICDTRARESTRHACVTKGWGAICADTATACEPQCSRHVTDLHITTSTCIHKCFCLQPHDSQQSACLPRSRRLQRAAGTHSSDDRSWKIEGSRD